MHWRQFWLRYYCGVVLMIFCTGFNVLIKFENYWHSHSVQSSLVKIRDATKTTKPRFRGDLNTGIHIKKSEKGVYWSNLPGNTNVHAPAGMPSTQSLHFEHQERRNDGCSRSILYCAMRLFIYRTGG
ncbi:hypothetical protein K458DRAFT_17722 [Lentithecium fluviatile CBS 122367]|uniref:Uncharacterized protein n=1 Tax=Lentithecium fluviatile CBS 122367 TaxID=1168545 RepID=A0A6G1J6I3_9PLEO|nr:hypothetical protein K458DRAFT_17722 [Lentithecium fluviatile CBS 122367]